MPAPGRGRSALPRRLSCSSPCSSASSSRWALIAAAILVVANLSLILVANVVALLYRAVAAIDAYRVVAFLNAQAEGDGRLGRRAIRLNPLSVAGLAAVCLVIAGAARRRRRVRRRRPSRTSFLHPGSELRHARQPDRPIRATAPISTDSPTPTLSLPPVGTALPSTPAVAHLERHRPAQHPAPGRRPAGRATRRSTPTR